MKDSIRTYIRKTISEGVKMTGGGHTFRAKPGSQVSFTDATSGKPVSGTFKKKVSRGGFQYAHVETGKQAYHVPVHQMHGAKKIEESEELDEISQETKKSYIKTAARDLKNIGLTYGSFQGSNPHDNSKSAEKFRSTNKRMMKNREKGIERALNEDDAHFAKQTPQMQTAINLHLRKGKSYSDAVAAAKKHVK